MHKLPTTDPAAEYGTPAMARSIARLTSEIVARQQQAKIIIMAGHPEGIIGFGEDLKGAVEELNV